LPPSASFWFVTCPVGAENVLRSAIPERHPGSRPSFARPGLLTFKSSAPWPPGASRPHPLARCWGSSLGNAASTDEVTALLGRVPHKPCLQVMPGEAGPLGRVPDVVLDSWAAGASTVHEELRLWLGDAVSDRLPEPGDPVLDIVVRPDEPWFVGWHRHTADRGPLPGGRWAMRAPAQAPSRAWAKLEELLAWSRADLRPRDVVLELGCAPGGATLVLLERGLRVVGVDPQDMLLPDELPPDSFTHLRGPIEALQRDQLPDDVAWIVVDLSVAAPVALRALQRLVKRYRSTLCGALLTLKLNEWSLVERAPDWLVHLEQMGLKPMGPAHLPSFRQEVAVAAFTEKGMARKRRS
jgi:23S rRNA (cytidine2498-2'-O)-methyltransferase